MNAVVHFAVAEHVHGLMGDDNPQLIVMGSAQLPGDSLDLLVGDLTVLVSRRSGRVETDQLEGIACQLRFEGRAEDTLESCIRKERARDDVEQRDVVIAGNDQAMRHAELIDETLRARELRPSRALRDVA